MSQDNKLIRSLLENVKAGNNASFEQLYQMYSGRVFTLSLRLSGNTNFAEETTKEVFIRAWKQVAVIRKDLSFSSWLTGITVYTVLEKLRDNKSGKFLYKKNDKKNYPLGDLDKEIISLPGNERLTFVLHDIENYSEKEIAELLLVKVEEVKTDLVSAQLKLRNSNNFIKNVESINLGNILSSNDIIPDSDVWKNIFTEFNDLQAKKTGVQNSKKEEPIENSETEEPEEKPEKKFSLFGRKKK